jgi:hypothetical protein
VFQGWDNYFMLLGTASGGLIGLLFVVVTLTAGLERSRALRASGIYLTPTLVHFAVTMVSSAVAVAPNMNPRIAASILIGAALMGLANAVRTCFGIAAFAKEGNPPHWSDPWGYGVAPGAIYVGLIGCAIGVWLGHEPAVGIGAGLLMVLMLVAIRNAWDLITWMAPRGPDGSGPPQPPGG